LGDWIIDRPPGEDEITVYLPVAISYFRRVAVLLGSLEYYAEAEAEGNSTSWRAIYIELGEKGVFSTTPLTSFRFYYQYDPAGYRYWFKMKERIWVELYPDGYNNAFDVVGQTEVDGIRGEVALRVNNPDQTGKLYIFIPERGQPSRWAMHKFDAEGEWLYTAEITYS
jgi:hypothetical protein